jgi:hypothetical protein
MLDLARSSTASRRRRLAGATLALAGAALLFGGGLVAGHGLAPTELWPAPRSARCAPPPGLALELISIETLDWIAERAIVCSDFEHGRIDRGQLAAALARIEARRQALFDDARLAGLDIDDDDDEDDAASDDDAGERLWAATVRASSSQYGTADWSASRALGAPDATAGQDDALAWAPEEADRGREWIELGFATPRRVDLVEIAESYNPGAVTRVELVGVDGRRTIAFQGAAAAPGHAGHRRLIGLACTAGPIVAVRVTLDSAAVPGWNEIDAVGVRPCD